MAYWFDNELLSDKIWQQFNLGLRSQFELN